jgi:demethylmenaquinone methyltransferase/2-methoxy-6-polyprenyl-1,4-benzoquinol methylase
MEVTTVKPTTAAPVALQHCQVRDAAMISEDGTMTRANLDKRPGEVAAMFDDVAQKYDLTNDVLSLGQDRRWRRLVSETVGAKPGDVVLDIAAGTGTSSEPFADAGVHVVPADFSLGMLRVGIRRRPDLAFTAADALRLPFANDSFDAVTMSFGLRNVVGTSEALEEFLRVTKPGGSLVICEFSHPRNKVFRTVYSKYLMRSLPSIARKVSSNPDSYVYLAESIQAWPDQAGMATLITAAGWQDVAWRNLTGGVVALHRATKAPLHPTAGPG